MSDAYDRALALATEAEESSKQRGPGLKIADKIALAQVWANLAVAEALTPKASGALRCWPPFSMPMTAPLVVPMSAT